MNKGDIEKLQKLVACCLMVGIPLYFGLNLIAALLVHLLVIIVYLNLIYDFGPDSYLEVALRVTAMVFAGVMVFYVLSDDPQIQAWVQQKYKHVTSIRK